MHLHCCEKITIIAMQCNNLLSKVALSYIMNGHNKMKIFVKINYEII
jgi:hypothetical protein